MAVYEWQGLNAKGREIKGVRDAESVRALRGLLRKEGVILTAALEEAEAKKRKARDVDFGRFFRRVSTTDIAMLTKQLATLLKSGVPLVEALNAMIDQLENLELKSALTQVRDKVNEGSSFADALRAHPRIFTGIYVNMVAAGEASGTLELVLTRLSEFLDAQSKLQSKVGSALAYPIFMTAMSLATVAVMMIVVVPKVTSIFESFGQALPWYTRLLIFTSDIFINYWWALIILGAFGVWMFRRWHATKEGRATWDRVTLKLPLFGKLFLMVSISRFTRTLATLLRSGVPLLTAMEITRNVLGNVELMRVIEEAAGSIREGESIAAPLKRSGRFPPIVTHMIAIGEKSGQLEEMLESVAASYDTQVDARVAAMASLLEPIMIIIMGGVSAFIAFAILMPLMSISQFVE